MDRTTRGPTAITASSEKEDGSFEFLSEAQCEGLADVLQWERPQTVALVLSRMSPERAGKVLVQFTPDMQTDVVRRLVDLEETDPEILQEVEHELQNRLSQKLHMHGAAAWPVFPP